MKIELGIEKPDCFVDRWPGQYEGFSYLEFAAGVPSVLFLITTLKGNGKPNACLHAWSTFSGDGGGYFAILSELSQNSHTYRNILRDKEFCINFLAPEYYDACIRTIEANDSETDEFTAGGFTPEDAKTVRPPRIREAFLSYECKLQSASDLSGAGRTALVIGKVTHAAVAQGYPSLETVCSNQSFMFYVHTPKNPVTGEGNISSVASLKSERLTE